VKGRSENRGKQN